ncbi:MAG: hypothetical protein DCC68_19525 [Planctomycetota bacterium]|nr:MAG: hypothetical protein DCC68_19525 [Planctomycetota bacterium]
MGTDRSSAATGSRAARQTDEVPILARADSQLPAARRSPEPPKAIGTYRIAAQHAAVRDVAQSKGVEGAAIARPVRVAENLSVGCSAASGSTSAAEERT